MAKYKLYICDVSGNQGNGYWISDVHPTNTIIELENPETASDRLINRKLGMRGVGWGGEHDCIIYGLLKCNDKPVAQLHRIND